MQHALSQVKDAPAIHLETAAPDYPQLLARILPAGMHVVCDANTRRDLPFPVFCFEKSPKPTRENVELIRAETAKAEALVAVGSGTINDLVKYAAFLDNKPYAVIASAPSMNGFVSANASIIVGDAKQSLAARGPVAVLADLPALCAAPLPLIQAGIGDTLCRSTVQADWLLAHLVKGVAYEPMYFEWLREHEQALFDFLNRASARREAAGGASALGARPPQIIKTLFEALLISGLAMRHHGSSMPASQGEHMIAHTRESMFPDLPSHFHGLEIAVTTLTMAEIQDKVLASEFLPPCHPGECRGPEPRMPSSNGMTKERWQSIRASINAIRLPTASLRAALANAGCPLTPADLGWPEAQYRKAVARARFSRERFTFLDVE